MKKFLFLLFINLSIATVFSFFLKEKFFYTWNLKLTDALYIGESIRPHVTIVGIDDKSIKKLGKWPFKRSFHSKAIEILTKYNAKVIGIDILFAEETAELEDKSLISALKKTDKVIFPVVFDFKEKKFTYPLLKFRKYVSLGHVNIIPDKDGVVRRVPLFINGQKAFALAILEKINPNLDLNSLPIDKEKNLLINYFRKPSNFPKISFIDLLEENFSPNLVKDKIILIGITDPTIPDAQLTPISKGYPMFGVEIHANILETILNKKFLIPQSEKSTIILLLFLSVFLTILFWFLRPIWTLFLSIFSLGFYFILASILFEKGLVLNLLYPLFTIFFVFIGTLIYKFTTEEKEKRFIKKAFSQYLSKPVIDQLLKNPKILKLGGEKKILTVLFSDIRNFTSLAEKISPEELVRFLNNYLTQMTEIILKNKGVVDKFIGDAIMAFWGAPIEEKNHPELACKTALEMIDELKRFNKKSKIKINIGIGINTGEMIVGNMGSLKRFDYTVIGDAVNLASRLESLNKEFKTNIIISENVFKEIKDKFNCKYLGEIKVKGKEKPVKIYELVSFKGNSSNLK